MKNKLFKVALVMAATSCVLGSYAQQRSLADAKAIADGMISSKVKRTPSKDMAPMSELKLVRPAAEILKQQSMSADAAPFYLFANNSTSGKGFVLVSGDARMRTVLGYSDSEVIDADNLPEGLRFLLERYAEEWKMLQSSNVTSGGNASPAMLPAHGAVAPLLGDIEWNQNDPYNSKCPVDGEEHSATGCVATVMAQVMKYYNYPDHGIGTADYTTKTRNLHVTYDFAKITFDWTNMLPSYRGVTATDAQKDAVAELMFACGAAVDMDYTSDQAGSSATDVAMMKGLVGHFGYDTDMASMFHDKMSETAWQQMLVDEINAGRPVIISGQDGSNGGGHSFILDGFQAITEGVSTPMYHVNWSWGGLGNGYYATTSLKPELSEEVTGGGQYNYSSDMKALIGIMPENGKIDRPIAWQGSSFSISPSSIKLDQEDQFTLRMFNTFNNSYRTFTGNFNVYLKDANGNETRLYTIDGINEVKYNAGFNDYALRASTVTMLEFDLEPGDYDVVVKSQEDNGEENIITFANALPTLKIEAGQNQEFKPTIYAQSITPAVTDGTRNVSVSLAKPMNYDSSAYVGDFCIALADADKNIKKTFAQTSFPHTLKYGEPDNSYTTDAPFVMQGNIPDDVADGHYYIYPAASKKRFTGTALIRQITSSNEVVDIEHNELWISNGNVYTYDPTPRKTHIYAVLDYALNDGNEVSVSISKPFNYCTEDTCFVGDKRFGGVFGGDFGIALYDINKNPLEYLGSMTYPGEILYDAVIVSSENPYTVTCNIPSTHSDGHYFVSAVARYKNNEWSNIKLLNIEEFTIGGDVYMEIWIKDGKVYDYDPEPGLTIDPDIDIQAEALDYSIEKIDNAVNVTLMPKKLLNCHKGEITVLFYIGITNGDADKLLYAFGNAVTCSYEKQYISVNFNSPCKGVLPKMADGHYKFCAAVRQKDTDNFNIVKSYVRNGEGKITMSGLGKDPITKDFYIYGGKYTEVLGDLDADGVLSASEAIVLAGEAERNTANGKFGTICLPTAFTIEGAKVYSAKVVDNSVVLTEVETPVAGVPYIFESTADAQTFKLSGAPVAAPVAAAPLVGVFADTEINNGYILQAQADGIQRFYKVNGSITVPANKAYLNVSSDAKAIGFYGEATAINAVNALVAGDAKIYDLSGRKLKGLKKGVNIVNGVTVLVK